MKTSMNCVSNNVQLALTDGTVGTAFFFAGNGVFVTKQGARAGELSQANLDDIARAGEAGENVADRVAQFLTPHQLTAESRRALALSASEWIELHSL